MQQARAYFVKAPDAREFKAGAASNCYCIDTSSSGSYKMRNALFLAQNDLVRMNLA
jgi:hypothetical protein